MNMDHCLRYQSRSQPGRRCLREGEVLCRQAEKGTNGLALLILCASSTIIGLSAAMIFAWFSGAFN